MANEYITKAQLAAAVSTTRLAEYTAESGTTVDDTNLDVVREEVSRFMDGYVMAQKAVPVTDAATIALLRPHARVLCLWVLHERRDIEPSDALKASYKSTMKWLEGLLEGKPPLPTTATEPTEPTDAELAASWGAESQVFTSPDPDDLDDNAERS